MENSLNAECDRYEFNTNFMQKRSMDRDRIEYISISRIVPNPYQPRKKFNKIALEELAESIKTYGVLQPISVRRTVDGIYELVAGERRLRAAKMAGLEQIPCIRVELNDNESAIIALIENIQREDLNYVEEAESYSKLLSENGLTQDELATKIGRSQSAIANKIRLLKLSPVVRKVLIDSSLTERHARALLKLDSDQEQLKILKIVCTLKLNVKETEELIARTTEKKDEYDSEDNISVFVKDPECTLSTGTYDVKEQPAVYKPESSIHDRSQHIKHVIKDLRIFVNTIRESVNILRDSGVHAKAAQFDRGEYLEFIIRIPKKENEISSRTTVNT